MIKRWQTWFLGVALLMAGMVYFFYIYPHRYIGPAQPIPFSHRVHAGVKDIDCRFCHAFVDRGRHAGIPSMQKCFFCHDYIIPQHPEIVKERKHYDADDPVKWVRIFYLPDYVKFQHVPHMEWGKLECTECHGPVQTMDRLRPVEFEMKFCITCHKEKKAQTDCWLACHH
jgi:predicted CXXCH cytochrome family protein